jgi:hypothetical protein
MWVKKTIPIALCLCLAGSVTGFATIVYQNDYQGETVGGGFPAWNWGDNGTVHNAVYADYEGNIVVEHTGTLGNSTTAARSMRFGSKWDITLSGNTSLNPADYYIAFDIRSVSGNWDPISLEFFVLTKEGGGDYGYGSGAAQYAQADGWIHVEANLADLSVNWWQGQAWVMTNPSWSIEVGGPPYPGTSVPAGTPSWDQIWLMDNLIITMGERPPSPANELATNPIPDDKATDVVRETDLKWIPGQYAASHDVYLGTSLDDVTNATRANPLGVLAKQALDVNSFDPAGRFEFGTTYYWRVDEVNAAPTSTIFTGSVWSFTVEPYSYEVTGVTASASSSSQASTGPQKTVDGSGLNANGEHGTAVEDGWLSGTGSSQWIQYELPQVLKLDKMLVWNSNQTLEGIFGFGAKDVLIQYSTDGTAWTDLGNFVFNQATGSADYTANTTVDFAGAAAKFVKLNMISNWGGIFQQYGLSEVRFYSIPVVAREPSPTPGSANLHPQVTMSWRAGREAASHEVYVSTDATAVAGGTIQPATTTQAKYEAALDLGQTYYWKVAEVNQAETPTTWPGEVWSFSTTSFISVDDFEGYTNDSPNRVFQTWIDGSGFSPDEFFPNGSSGNGTGSLVGYDPLAGDVMETTYIYGGRQSMPLYYDNSAAPKISEAVRTLDPAKDTTDWTKYGLTTLVVWFRGDPANGAAPIYVKINNTKKLYNNGAAATTMPFWKPFQIDLASVPAADLKNVKTLTIGVGDGSAGGEGTILIDEIRLYATAPQIAVPTDPGTSNLEALYSMEGNVQDSSGNDLNGAANGDPSYVDGPAGYGKALAFDGTNDYVDLPIGDLLSTLGGSTFAAMVDFGGGAGGWQRIFDFGTDTTVYMFLTPRQGTTGAMRSVIRTAAIGEQGPNGLVPVPTDGWHHVAMVFDDAAMRIRLYMDGALVGNATTLLLPRDMGVTTQNWLGRSQWSADAYLNGAIDDFRIYSRPLSEGEIRYLAGDR